MTADNHRFAQHGEYMIGNMCGGVSVADFVKQNVELIATRSPNGVFAAHAGAQTLRDVFQQLVADLVTQHIIDFLELIQIQIKQRGRSAATGGVLEGLFEAIHEQPPVCEVGERVIEREPLHLFLTALDVGDVSELDDEVFWRPFTVLLGHRVQCGVAQLTVGSLQLLLAMQSCAGAGNQLLQRLFEAGTLLWHQQVGKVVLR